MNQTERAPLQPAERTYDEPYKTNTALRRHLLRLADFAQVLLTIERVLGDEDLYLTALCADWGPYVQLNAKDEAHSRLLVGRLIRAFGVKPAVKKVGDDELASVFAVTGVEISVRGYKPKTCRYEEIEVVVPAERRKVVVTPAKPKRVEKRRVLVCDPPVEEPAAPAPAAEEVPW